MKKTNTTSTDNRNNNCNSNILNIAKTYRFKYFSRKNYGVFNSLNKVVNIGVLTCCILTVAPASSIIAQNITPNYNEANREKKDALELEEVMVTASKVEIPIQQSAKLVTLITKEMIEKSPAVSIQDLLMEIANIDVQQKGPNGVQADISLRGGSKDQTAVLVNGINLSNAHTGGFNLDIPVNISDIERIEIIHGPSALIYGSSAFAGGINIITKKRPMQEASLSAEAGMHNLFNGEIRGSSLYKNISGSISASHKKSSGYANNTDYHITNILAQTRVRIADYSRFDIMLGFNEKRYGANSFYTALYLSQYDHIKRYQSSVKGEFGDKIKLIPIAYWFKNYDTFELVRGTEIGKNYHKLDTYGTNIILQFSSSLGTSSIGTEIRKDNIKSSVLGKPLNHTDGHYKNQDERTNTSFTLENTFTVDKWILSGGLLMNYNTLEKSKYKFLPSLNVNYKLTEEFNIFCTWSNSLRMPSFTEMWYTTETHESNSNLKPEYSNSFEMGIKYTKQTINAYFTAFMMNGRNIIDWVQKEKEDGNIVFASWNHTRLNTVGIETGISFRFTGNSQILKNGLILSADYAKMSQTKDTAKEISKFKKNYLRDKFTLRLNHHLTDKFSIGWYYRFQHRVGSYDVYDNSTLAGSKKYKPFSTLDIKGNYKINNIKLHLDLKNIFNVKTNDMGNVPQPGFWLMTGILWSI